MSIATLIERVVGKQRKRQEVKLADFHDVVRQIADGREPDDDFVVLALRDADKSVDDLQAAVALLQRRRELRKQWNNISALATPRQRLRRQMAEADKELEAAEKEHYDSVNPLIAELQRINEGEQEGRQARQELLATCTDQSLLDKLADVQLRLSARRDEAARLRGRIDDLRSRARSERAEAEHQKMIVDGGDRVKVHLARAKEHDRAVSEREAALRKIDKLVAGLEREEETVREQMLVP
jgi:hypothetical protein